MPTHSQRDFADPDAVGFVQDGRDQSHREPLEIFDPCDLDTLPEQVAERFGLPLPQAACIAAWHIAEKLHAEQFAQARTLAQTVEFTLGGNNAKLRAIALAFAGGLDVASGATMACVAERQCVTRAAISKLVNQACDALHLPRSRYMKSASAREAYRSRATEVHRRNRHSPKPSSQSHDHQPHRQDQRNPQGTLPRRGDGKVPVHGDKP